MVLYRDKDLKVIVGDIETLACCTDLGFYDPDTGKWFEFEMSEYRNDLYEFVAFYSPKKWDYVVGYNYRNFDAQVIQYILYNYKYWYDLNGKEIAAKVYEFTQRLIDDSNYGLFVPYRESQFAIKVIDVYLIFGLDNEARRSSLKKCEFQIDFPSVEEMPIHHSVSFLTESEVKDVKSYRRNDVLATYELLKMSIGDTTHAIYKSNNQIELRISIKEEFGIDCINFSDIKIGEEILKKSYAAAIKKEIWELPKKGTFRKYIQLSNCIPSYVSFQTEQLQKLLKMVKNTKLSQFDKLEHDFTFYKTRYIQALGGLHSVNKNEVYKETNEYEIHDYDVSSMYPAIIVNHGYFPKHLGKELLQEYSTLYHKRLSLKPLAKTDKKIKGIVEGLKLALNAVFGKMGDMESWLYDKETLLSVTLTGQFCLLMLIEAYELAGFHVISANTDGVTVLVNKNRISEIEKINEEWQNKTKFVLEKALYKSINYSTVNDYIAIKEDGKAKVKGDYIKDFDLWKNKSHRVIPMALEEYFVNKKDPIEYIKNHKNIYDFCIMARATGQLHLEEQWDIEGGKIEVKKHKKLIRYYLSNCTDRKLYKRGISSTNKPMDVCLNANNDIGDIYVQYFNQYEEKKDYCIAYEHYILKVLQKIDAVEKTNKAKKFIESLRPTTQQSLF